MNAERKEILLPVSVEFKASPEIQSVRRALAAKQEILERTRERKGRSNPSILSVEQANNRRDKEIEKLERSIAGAVRIIEFADSMWKLGGSGQLEHLGFFPSEAAVETAKNQVAEKRRQKRKEI